MDQDEYMKRKMKELFDIDEDEMYEKKYGVKAN